MYRNEILTLQRIEFNRNRKRILNAQNVIAIEKDIFWVFECKKQYIETKLKCKQAFIFLEVLLGFLLIMPLPSLNCICATLCRLEGDIQYECFKKKNV